MLIESGTRTNVERVTYHCAIPSRYKPCITFFIIKKLGLNRLNTKCLTRFVVSEKIIIGKKKSNFITIWTKENDGFNIRFQVLLGVIIIVLKSTRRETGVDRRVDGQRALNKVKFRKHCRPTKEIGLEFKLVTEPAQRTGTRNLLTSASA